MDPKKTFKKEVESALEGLNQKIDSMKERVEKLCETTGCFRTAPQRPLKKDKK